MATPDNSAEIRQLVAVYQTKIDDFLTNKTDYPLYEAGEKGIDPLQLAIFNHPLLGREYLNGFAHDFASIAIAGMNFNNLGTTSQMLEVCARGKALMVNSVLAEFGFTPESVDVNKLVCQQVIFLSEQYKSNLVSHYVPKTEVRSALEDEPWVILGHEGATYRVLLNIVRNSERGIEARHLKSRTKGSIEFSKRELAGDEVLTVTDNGSGFNHLFESIGLDTKEEQIPLYEVIERSRGRSGFGEQGLGGTGQGLGIMQHMIRLIGAEVFVTNPRHIDGSQVSLKFP